MFNDKISDEDILQSMEENLFKVASEEVSEYDNIKKQAIELLNIAADKFEQSGLIKQASIITKIMEVVAKEKSPNSEQQINNLLTHGTPLNLPASIKMKATPGKRDYSKADDAIIIVEDDKELDNDDLEDIKNLF